jgi:hypothetical protein
VPGQGQAAEQQALRAGSVVTRRRPVEGVPQRTQLIIAPAHNGAQGSPRAFSLPHAARMTGWLE